MKTNKLIQSISIAFSGLFLFIIGLIKFIKSYSYYSDEYGTDISFDNNYVVLIVIALIILFYGVYRIYLTLKSNEKDSYKTISLFLVSSLSCFYPLGVFFKAFFKAKNKGVEFDFASNQIYLFVGLFFLFLVVSFASKLIEESKERNN